MVKKDHVDYDWGWIKKQFGGIMIKTNKYGNIEFDWDWASRHGFVSHKGQGSVSSYKQEKILSLNLITNPKFVLKSI